LASAVLPLLQGSKTASALGQAIDIPGGGLRRSRAGSNRVGRHGGRLRSGHHHSRLVAEKVEPPARRWKLRDEFRRRMVAVWRGM